MDNSDLKDFILSCDQISSNVEASAELTEVYNYYHHTPEISKDQLRVFGKTIKYDTLDSEPFVMMYKFYSEYVEYDIYKYFKITIDMYTDRTIAEQQRMIKFVKHFRELESKIKKDAGGDTDDDLLAKLKEEYEN